jgi:hypothetical protein
VSTDYFTADEYARILSATYRLDEYAERSWGPERRGTRIRALAELMRWSVLRTRDAATLGFPRSSDNKLMLYQAKTGIPVFVPLPPEVADLRNPDGTCKRAHCHMFRDTFAVEMLLGRRSHRLGLDPARPFLRAHYRAALLALGPRPPGTTRKERSIGVAIAAKSLRRGKLTLRH